MIGEKIAELRRTNNMSQEELADRLGISRQSVSKWESGQSLPDIEKLPLLSDIFHVSIDYLVKEDTVPAVQLSADEEPASQPEDTPYRDARFRDWEEAVRKTFFSAAPKEETEKYILRKEEAEEFIELRTRKGELVARSTAECVGSVVPVLIMAALSEGVSAVNESAVLLGVVGMFLMIAHAVSGFIRSAGIGSQYAFLDKTELLPEYDAEEVIEARCPELKQKSRSDAAVGVVLCILSVTPLLLAVALTELTDFTALLCVCVMFGMIADAVRRFVKAGFAAGIADRLMQEGDYAVKTKQQIDFKSIYWSVITVIYFSYSAVTGSWGTSWIIWVIARIAWPFVSGEKGSQQE